MWRMLADIVRVPAYKDTCAGCTGAVLAVTQVLSLQERAERQYTATEIEDMADGFDKA